MPRLSFITKAPEYEKCDGGVVASYVSGDKKTSVAMSRNTFKIAIERGGRLIEELDIEEQGVVSPINPDGTPK